MPDVTKKKIEVTRNRKLVKFFSKFEIKDEMICRLCLKDAAIYFNIFAEKGVELQVAEVVAKYFWFEPKPDDPISTVICDSCWNKIADFNEFYEIVEEAHRLLTERFSLKLDTSKSKKKENFTIDHESATKSATIESSQAKTEAERTAVAMESYEAFFSDVLEDRNGETLEKIETEISLQHIEADDIPFGEENEFTEYLSLDEQEKSEEDTLQIPAIDEEINESKRITRAGSKRNQAFQSSPTLKICKRTSKLDALGGKTKKCGRPKKKPVATLESPDAKADISIKDDLISLKADKANKGNHKDKYRDIDERISRYLSLQCDICGAREATFAELSKHMLTVHNFHRGYAKCCDKKFYRRSLLFHHIEKHLNPECFRCEDCDKAFANRQCLRNHMLVKHQPDEAKIFGCSFCEKKFAKPYLLEQHQRKHEERNHICEMCQKGFATVNLLNAHINIIHNNYGTMCEICAKVIRGRSAFARHVLEHQGVTLPKVQCPKCSAWYKDKHSLQKHIRRHNEEGTVHICNECGKVAPNRSALLAHKRYVHKARLFECGICKKAFKKQIGLKEHMTMHTGETLYSCPYCPRTFNSNANMHSHRKKMHPKEFAEARLKRHETKTMYPKNEEIQQQYEQITTDGSEHHLMLTNDSEILISPDKLSELVFKIS